MVHQSARHETKTGFRSEERTLHDADYLRPFF